MEYSFTGQLYINSDTLMNNRNVPTWFALKKETAQKYATNIYQIDIKQPLKLLNITTWTFRTDLFDRLNNHIWTSESFRRLKSIALMSLGLPSYNIQLQFMQKYLHSIPRQYSDEFMTIDTCTFS